MHAELTVSVQQERVKAMVRMVCALPGPVGRAGPCQLREEGLQEAGLPRLLTSLPLPNTWKMSLGCLHHSHHMLLSTGFCSHCIYQPVLTYEAMFIIMPRIIIIIIIIITLCPEHNSQLEMHLGSRVYSWPNTGPATSRACHTNNDQDFCCRAGQYAVL